VAHVARGAWGFLPDATSTPQLTARIEVPLDGVEIAERGRENDVVDARAAAHKRLDGLRIPSRGYPLPDAREGFVAESNQHIAGKVV